VKKALSRVVKRIMVIKRLSIIRQVNEVIEAVCQMKKEEDDDEEAVSFKKLVKIMNLCHVYIPIFHQKPNNSSYLSLETMDLLELTRSKEAYKSFVEL
jgi:hypothetical protein